MAKQGKSCLTVAGCQDMKTIALKIVLRQFGNLRFIVHHEDRFVHQGSILALGCRS